MARSDRRHLDHTSRRASDDPSTTIGVIDRSGWGRVLLSASGSRRDELSRSLALPVRDQRTEAKSADG